MKVSIMFRIGILAFVASITAFTGQVDSEIRSAFEKMTRTWLAANPADGMKKGLSVLPFTVSGGRIAPGLDVALRDIMSAQIPQSQVFFLIDRDTLEASLKEQTLSLSGIVDDKQLVKVGKIAGVAAFITGSAGEVGDDMVLSLKLVDASTGSVAAMEQVKVPVKDVEARKKELSFAYISKYGLGINVQSSFAFLQSPLAAAPTCNFTDIFLNYRPLLWLNFKLGVTQISFSTRSMNSIPLATIYPDVSNYNFGSLTYTGVNYNVAGFDSLGLFIGADVNYTPVEFFTCGFGIVWNQINRPVYVQNYTPLIEVVGGTNTSPGNLYIEQTLWNLNIFRIEVKPQFFLSPRLTVGLYAAVLLSPSFSVYKTVVNGDIYYPQDYSGTSAKSVKNAGMSLLLLADGKNIQDLTFMGGILLGGSLNFFF